MISLKKCVRGIGIGGLIALLTLLTGGRFALAQEPVSARVDRTTLSVDEQLSLTVTITGEFLNIPTPDLSGLVDFSIVGKSEATQITIINGRLTSQKEFLYRLKPLRAGLLEIPPISAEVDGQLYQTNPIQVEVFSSALPSLPAEPGAPFTDAPDGLMGQDFFVEAEIDNSRPYLGQQIIYTFRLFQASNFYGQPDYRPPAFTDFWSQTLFSQPRYQTSAGGRDYLVTEIRTALFPGSLGLVTIAPGKLVIPGGLFDPDVILESDPISLEVRSLPEGEPADFKGAVGQFQINASFNTFEGKVNEPLTFVLEITGAGNIEVLTEPALPEMPNWRMFESQPATTIEPQGDIIYGSRRFERLMVPGQAGDYTFPSVSFSYYDPQAETYQTITSAPIHLTIQPGAAEPPASVLVTSPDKQQIEIIAGDIRHIKAVPTSLERTSTRLWANPLYWGLWVLPVFVVGGVWLRHARQQRLQGNLAYLRSQQARRNAYKILSQAEVGTDRYAAAQRALLGYLSDKLNRPTVGLTTPNLLRLLGQTGLEHGLIKRVETTLNHIDIGRFAPGGEAVTQSLLTETERLIDDLEKSFGGR